jgi:hypothetical protein
MHCLAALLRVVAVVAAVLPATAAPAAAQAKSTPLGTYKVEITRAVGGTLLAGAQAVAADALLDQLLPVVRANEAASRTPPDRCMQLGSHHGQAAGRPVANVSVFMLAVIDGACYNLYNIVIVITANDPRTLPASGRIDMPGESRPPQILPPLQQTGTIAGFPRYGNRVVISKPGVPLFLPVPKEQQLRALERRLQASLNEARAEFEKGQRGYAKSQEDWLNGGRARMIADNERALKDAEATMTPEKHAEYRRTLEQLLEAAEFGRQLGARMAAEQRARQPEWERQLSAPLDSVRAELARLTPAQLQQPACQVAPQATSTGPTTCPIEQQLRVWNTAYFDDTLPAGAVQLIVVEIGEVPGDPRRSAAQRSAHPQQQVIDRIIETLDYAALARLIR